MAPGTTMSKFKKRLAEIHSMGRLNFQLTLLSDDLLDFNAFLAAR